MSLELAKKMSALSEEITRREHDVRALENRKKEIEQALQQSQARLDESWKEFKELSVKFGAEIKAPVAVPEKKA